MTALLTLALVGGISVRSVAAILDTPLPKRWEKVEIKERQDIKTSRDKMNTFLSSSAPVTIAQSTPTSATGDRLFAKAVESYQAQQFAEAVRLWKLALTAYLQIDDKLAAATTLKNLSAVYLAQRDYPQAIDSLQQYLSLIQKLGYSQEQAAVLTSLGDIYANQGSYSKAISYYQQALSLAQEQVNRPQEGIILGNLAIAYKTLGNYVLAIQMNQQAIEILQEVKNPQNEGLVWNNLGNTYEALGDYDNAIAAYEKSLAIARQLNNKAGEAVSLNNLGGIYANQGKYEEAIATFQTSLQLSQNLGDDSTQASTLINLGSAYHSLGKLDLALQNYQQSLQLAQAASDKKRQIEGLGSLGLVYEDLKQYSQAIASLQKSLQIARELGDPSAQGMALNNLGHTYLSAGKLKAAETTLRDAVKLLDNLRPGLNDTYKVSIFDTQIHTYNLLKQILVAANKPEAALEAAEQGRARAFVELLAGRLTANQTSAIATAPSIKQIRAIAKQQNATLVEYAIVPDDDFKFRGKQRARESELLIWVVPPTGKVTLRRVDLKFLWQHNLTLTDLVNASRCLDDSPYCFNQEQAIAQLGEESNSSYIGLRKLHKILIEPIADLLPKDPSDRIVFIPQDSLFLTPFAALKNADGKYLIQQHTILTAPAIQVLDLTRRQKKRIAQQNRNSLQPLIIGNPTMPTIFAGKGNAPKQLEDLPEAEREASEIAKLFNHKALIGAEATKANVKQLLTQANLVHFATHGLLEYRAQKSSSSLKGLEVPGALALAPAGKDDGLLTASEIFDLELVAEFVVLSACDTGRGRITGDGVIGLSRAFISAGVPSVLVSLWKVPDNSTAKLMIGFYEQLQTQPDKAQALRQAMLKLMQTDPEPLNWSGFTLIGEAN